MSTSSSLLLVHGRGFKPEPDAYLDISLAAMRSGIARDYPDQTDLFDEMRKELAWYGDLNAEALHGCGENYDESLDVGDRRNALAALREFKARKKFGIGQYDRLPGKSAIPEFVADVAAPLLSTVGLTMPVINLMAKDFARYFDKKSPMATQARERVRTKLCALLESGDRVAMVTHGLGSVIAYDVLWQLSHDPDSKQDYGPGKIDLWMTLGAPLGDTSVRKRLLGAKEKSTSRYPANVITWHNIAAEDDYMCHDNTVADDYSNMMQQRVVSAVNDHKIFNLAVRYGKSNPHSSVGYYIHPRVSKVLADWLCSEVTPKMPKYTL